MSIDPRTGVVVTDTSDAELALKEHIRLAQQEAVLEVLLRLCRVVEQTAEFSRNGTVPLKLDGAFLPAHKIVWRTKSRPRHRLRTDPYGSCA